MSLSQRQQDFAVMAAKLILRAAELGYKVTLGDAYRDPRVHGAYGTKASYSSAFSNHKRRLAIDLNLFKDGQYITDGSGHDELHEFWTSIGGDPAIKNDANHYQYTGGG